jgi:hypothetical protein
VNGAGIGSGFGGNGSSSVGVILIDGGIVTAIGASHGAGIGAGYVPGQGNSTVGNLSIFGGSFTVNAISGAGIGAGDGSLAYVSSVTIKGGTFNITSHAGAAVGAYGYATVANLSLLGGSFYLSGHAGVGAANDSSLSTLTVGSPHLDCRPLGTEICLRASSVLFDAGSMMMVTGSSKMIDFDTLHFSEASEIYTIYTGTSMQELITGIPIIHIQLATSLPYQISKLIVRNSDNTTAVFEREVFFDSSAHRGFAISVPSIGNYKFTLPSNDSLLCFALSRGNVTTFAALTEGDTFYDEVRIADRHCHPTPLRTVMSTPTFQLSMSSSAGVLNRLW